MRFRNFWRLESLNPLTFPNAYLTQRLLPNSEAHGEFALILQIWTTPFPRSHIMFPVLVNLLILWARISLISQRLQGIPSNLDGWRGYGKNNLCYKWWNLLLHKNAIWVKKWRSWLSRRHEQKFWRRHWDNLEIYTDDIIVKSKTKATAMADLKQVFDRICKIVMKLNLKNVPLVFYQTNI